MQELFYYKKMCLRERLRIFSINSDVSASRLGLVRDNET